MISFQNFGTPSQKEGIFVSDMKHAYAEKLHFQSIRRIDRIHELTKRFSPNDVNRLL